MPVLYAFERVDGRAGLNPMFGNARIVGKAPCPRSSVFAM